MSTSPRPLVTDLSEADLLDRILPLLAVGEAERVGPGDDAAVLDLDGPAVVTTDTLVHTIDWRDDWSTPEDVAVKAVVQNLADLAAMGATPRSLLLACVVDRHTTVEWVTRFAAQVGLECRRYAVSAVGGDLSSAPDGTRVVAITAIGVLGGREPVLRSGARPGDRIAVAGALGRSAVGLALLVEAAAEGRDPATLPREALAHHRRPSCPLNQGPIAADAGATAMIDISDGLLRDADRIARASGVALALDGTALAPDLNWAERHVSRAIARGCVLAGGEEHSLLACFPDGVQVPPWWRVIGAVRAGAGVWLDDKPVEAAGWDHFAGRSA